MNDRTGRPATFSRPNCIIVLVVDLQIKKEARNGWCRKNALIDETPRMEDKNPPRGMMVFTRANDRTTRLLLLLDNAEKRAPSEKPSEGEIVRKPLRSVDDGSCAETQGIFPRFRLLFLVDVVVVVVVGSELWVTKAIDSSKRKTLCKATNTSVNEPLIVDWNSDARQ